MNDVAGRPTENEIADFVERHFAAKGACDRELLAEQFVEDVRSWIPLSMTNSGVVERPIQGASRLLDLITTSLVYSTEGREWTVLDWVSDGVKVAVRARLKAFVAATGEPYENEYTFFMRLEGLRIAEVWETFDSAYALERLRPA